MPGNNSVERLDKNVAQEIERYIINGTDICEDVEAVNELIRKLLKNQGFHKTVEALNRIENM